MGDKRLLKPKTFDFDIGLPPLNRDHHFLLPVLPSPLVSCLQIGIVEDLCAGTKDVLNAAR